jgi:hypothetical protein
MIETGEVRKRVKQAIEQARRNAAAHRTEADAASAQFDKYAQEVAGPLFRQVAGALKAEGYPFQVFTPAGGLRLSSDRSGDDYVGLVLDTARHPVALVLQVRRTRGRHVVDEERTLAEGASIDGLSDDELLGRLLEALAPFVER